MRARSASSRSRIAGVPAPRKARWHLLARLLIPGVLLFAAWLIRGETEHLRAVASSPFPVVATLRYPGLDLTGGDQLTGLDQLPVPLVETVQRGESPLVLLTHLGLAMSDAMSAVSALEQQLDPRQLRAGTRYVGYVSGALGLSNLVFELPDRGRLALQREASGSWSAALEPYRDRTVMAVVHGEVVDSLEAAIKEAGAHGALAYQLAQVFQWDLDFNRDLRTGDRFSIVYQQVWRDGRVHHTGDVLAASYVNRGRTLEAFRFGEDGGYYDRDGRALRKQFLRSPMRFSRITSRFSKHRFHPILKVSRPHYGVDYGAPVGTPVHVTASGVVVSAGWDQGGGGRVVKVRHPNGYLTAYLHLSRFAEGVRSGRRVRQGEVIGFVGSTGLATGPHLDYRVQTGGHWVDPLSLKSEPAPPLADQQLAAFDLARQNLEGLLSRPELPSPSIAEERSRISTIAP